LYVKKLVAYGSRTAPPQGLKFLVRMDSIATMDAGCIDGNYKDGGLMEND
jgi:hypothetical protein